MASTRGGKRPGAGRRKGGVNKMTEKARKAASATGLLPHELLLAMSRGESTPGVPKPLRREIIDARKAAAPYYAPKQASTEFHGSVDAEGRLAAWLMAQADGKSRGLPSARN
ncbi:MAG: hypothetical protein SGI92_15000 [Bryobacteraceae bacterium]|nr:hypothetical protein [Bryobacteraceae bacterium]